MIWRKRCWHLCAKISAKPETAVRLGKGLFYQQLEMGVQAAYQLAGQTMACNMMDDSAQEGFQAFIEKAQAKLASLTHP